MRTITYTRAADMALRAMATETAQRVEGAVEHYVLTGQGAVKAMKGSPTLRLRVGDCRVIFTETLVVLDVIAIGHRSHIYR